MEVIGKIYEITPVETGVSKNGNTWYRRILVIQTMEDNPKNIVMSLFGEDKCKSVEHLKFGTIVTAKISLDGRKYNNKWYPDISCISVVGLQAMSNNNVQQQQQQYVQQPQQAPQQPQAAPQQLNNPAMQQLQTNFGGEMVADDDNLPF